MSVPSLAELRLGVGRKGNPLRQRELAEIAQLDQTYVSALENGKRKPSPYLQVRLAAAFDIPLEKLRASIRETLRRAKAGEEQLRTDF
jgi:transcriptional regulator with XRE-family HTH domain